MTKIEPCILKLQFLFLFVSIVVFRLLVCFWYLQIQISVQDKNIQSSPKFYIKHALAVHLKKYPTWNIYVFLILKETRIKENMKIHQSYFIFS